MSDFEGEWSERDSDWIEDDELDDMPGECQALRIAGEALVVRMEWGDEELVPLSVIADMSEVAEPGDNLRERDFVADDAASSARIRLAELRPTSSWPTWSRGRPS